MQTEPQQLHGLVSVDPQMLAIFDTVRRLGSFASNVLITGESGTGKELLARAIQLCSPRKAQKFIAVNCGAIPETLIESELFGHKKGSFTDAIRDKRGLIEEASGGTLFLDEIGEMSLLLQVKLLRVLQQKEIRAIGDENVTKVDTRIIAATNKNLELLIKRGGFREDLFYRLNVVALELPPLRDRTADIPLLCNTFLRQFSEKFSLGKKEISQAACMKLAQYNWPGNIRELENTLERLFLLTDSDLIDLQDLPEQIRNFVPIDLLQREKAEQTLSLKSNCALLESRLIKEALLRTAGNRTHAAKLLEISHRALLYKIKDYGLTGFMKT